MPRMRTGATTTAAALTCLVLPGCGGSPAPVGAGTPSPQLTSRTISTATSTATFTATSTATSAAAAASSARSIPNPGPRARANTASRTSTPSVTRAKPPGSTSLVPVPRAGAEPRIRFPQNLAAVGSGANATARRIPDAVWARMVGYSWTPRCPVGRSTLRYVTVNFWGFDGRRSRGALVVNAGIASRTMTAFTRLYQQGFRIRQMKVMDRGWGHNPKGPGANDYAAMQADNTSAFNCRFVGGEEWKKVWSRHAYGTAIDVNDFENPYVDEQGRVYPHRWFLTRRSRHAGVFSSASSAAVQAFTSQGFRWGGAWKPPDFQHFDLAR